MHLAGLGSIVHHFDHLQGHRGGASGTLAVERPGGRQQGIADFLRVQPPRAVPPHEPIGRVKGPLPRRSVAAELIGPAQHQRPHQLLERPALDDQAARQVVQQLRMRRRVTAAAEVIHGGDDALTEQVLPGAVDEDAQRERIVRTAEPAGQLQPAAPAPVHRRRSRHRERRQKTARHHRTEVLGHAADAQFRVADFLGLAHAVNGMAAGGRIGQPLQLGSKRMNFRRNGRCFG